MAGQEQRRRCEGSKGTRTPGGMLLLLSVVLAVGTAGWWQWPHVLSQLPFGTPCPEGAPSTAPPPRAAGADGWIKATGRVEPCSGLRRLVFKTEGVITECRVQSSSPVKKGDILLVLDNHEQQAAVALAQAALEQAKAERAKALSGAHPEEIAAAKSRLQVIKEQVRYFRMELERSRKGAAQAAVSQQEYAQSWTSWVQHAMGQMNAEAELRRLQQQVRPEDRALAEAKVSQAEAQLKVAEQRLGHTFLRAPSDGTVLEVLKHEGEGQRTMDSEPVLLFADTDHLCVRAEVDPLQAGRLAAGQDVQVHVRGPAGKSATGRVVAVRQVLGPHGAWGRGSSEHREADVLQVVIEVDSGFWAPLGLPVDVKIHVGG